MLRHVVFLLITVMALDAVPAIDGYFEADNDPADYIISSDEFYAYKFAWQRGQVWPEHGNEKIPLDKVSLSGTIIFGFEGAYHVEYDEEGNPLFIPGVFVPDDPSNGSWTETTITMVGPTPAVVYLDIDPPDGAVAYAVEERMPDGWEYFGSDDGYYCEEDQALRFGPSPASSETFEYEVLSILGGALEPSVFNSVISYDGVSEPLTTHYTEPQYGDQFRDWLWDEEADVIPSELWAFALLGSPDAEATNLMPVFTKEAHAEGFCFKARLYRYIWAGDIKMEFQYSTNLQDWYPVVDLQLTRLPDYNWGVVVYDVTIPCDSDEAALRFFRLEVQYLPTE